MDNKNKQITLYKTSKEIEEELKGGIKIKTETKKETPSNIESLEAFDENKGSSFLDNQEDDTKTKIYQTTLNILNILSDFSLKEAEKVSCQPGCKAAQQVYMDTMENLLTPVKKDKEDKEDKE